MEHHTDEKAKHLERLLVLAEAIATVAHEKQVDKQGVLYINHPKTVASFCESVPAKIVGWLHDVLEDTAVEADDLRRLGFDEYLVEAVELMTKPESGYDEQLYYKRIKENPLAKEVKLADLRHNTDADRIAGCPEELKAKLLKKREKYMEHIAFLTEA